MSIGQKSISLQKNKDFSPDLFKITTKKIVADGAVLMLILLRAKKLYLFLIWCNAS